MIVRGMIMKLKLDCQTIQQGCGGFPGQPAARRAKRTKICGYAGSVHRLFKDAADDSPSPWGEGRDEGVQCLDSSSSAAFARHNGKLPGLVMELLCTTLHFM